MPFREPEFNAIVERIVRQSHGHLHDAIRELIRQQPWREIFPEQSRDDQAALLANWFGHRLLRWKTTFIPFLWDSVDERKFAEEAVRGALLIIGHEELSKSVPDTFPLIATIESSINRVDGFSLSSIREKMPAEVQQLLAGLRLPTFKSFKPNADFLTDQIGFRPKESARELINGVLMFIGREVALAVHRGEWQKSTASREPFSPPSVPARPGSLVLVIPRSKLPAFEAPHGRLQTTTLEELLTLSLYYRCLERSAVDELQHRLSLSHLPSTGNEGDVYLRIDLENARFLIDERNKFAVRQHLTECGTAQLATLAAIDTLASRQSLAELYFS